MVTVKYLRAIAKQYELPGTARLSKSDLVRRIALARAPESLKRIERAMKTGRLSALQSDPFNPFKRGRRARELAQLNSEVDAALKSYKYVAMVKKNPRLRLKPLDKILHRQRKPHLHGLTRSKKETLARAIAREGPGLLLDQDIDLLLDQDIDLLLDQDIDLLLDPDEDYVLHVDDTPVRFPDVRYVKKGRDIDREGIVEAVRGRIYDLRPTTSGPDITDEGNVYWVSYEDEERRVTKDLASVVHEIYAVHSGWKSGLRTPGLGDGGIRPLRASYLGQGREPRRPDLRRRPAWH